MTPVAALDLSPPIRTATATATAAATATATATACGANHPDLRTEHKHLGVESRQSAADHCPVMRTRLSAAEGVVERVGADADAGDGAVRLAMLSQAASGAKAGHSADEVLAIARRLELGARRGDAPVERGLNAAQWSRLAVLCSYAQPLPHSVAAALPLLVLPPKGLHLRNPVQALQAFITCQFLQPGWSQRLRQMEALLPCAAARRALLVLAHAVLPRYLERGQAAHPREARWALEDAWRNALVQQRWAAFTQLLSPAQCTAVLARAQALMLPPPSIQPGNDAQATDGRNVVAKLHVPHARPLRRTPRRRGAVGLPVRASAAATAPGRQAALPM